MTPSSRRRSSPGSGCSVSMPRTSRPSRRPSPSTSSRRKPRSLHECAVMNLRSEIDFFSELRLVDKARLLNLFLHELAEEARATYGPADQVHDGAHLRFVNELYHRLTRV